MLRVTAYIALAYIAAGSHAQSASWYYDFKSKQSYAVATKKLGSFDRVLGSTIKLDALGFLGATKEGRPVAGYAVVWNGEIAKNLKISVGPAVLAKEGNIEGVSLFAGVTWRL